MSTDLIRYDLLAQEALRGVVRKVLVDIARGGLPGDHHFFISFRTDAPGVRVSNRLRDKHPQEMTIVLQHQFWDLGVTDHAFEVGLSFGGVPERLLVPFDALSSFVDPSVPFGMKFETREAEEPGNDDASDGAGPAITRTLPAALPQPSGGLLSVGGDRKPARGAGSEPDVAVALVGKGVGKGDGKADAKSDVRTKADRAAAKASDAVAELPRGKDEKAKDEKLKSDKPKSDKAKPEKAADGSAEVFSLDSFRKKK